MHIETIARKLKPVLPTQVEHWMRLRQLADPELKSLIEKQIISAAYQVLGDFQSKILLSLPPESKAKGSIPLGTVVYDTPKHPFGISRKELMQNMAILGRSGAGKTNVSFHLLKQLVDKKIPFVFLDWKRTVRHLLKELNGKVNIYTAGRSLVPFAFNPFVVPPGVEPKVYVNQVIDVMAEAFTLGDGARSLLRTALAAIQKERRGTVALGGGETPLFHSAALGGGWCMLIVWLRSEGSKRVPATGHGNPYPNLTV